MQADPAPTFPGTPADKGTGAPELLPTPPAA
jgi:hypothetical protein